MQLTLWINAFIPRTVAGYTRVIPTGVHMGKTAVPLPGLALLNPGNWSVHTDNGFLTDQRDFDNAPTASVRMQSLAVVEVSNLSLASQAHRSSGTTQVDMANGAVRGFAIASMARCRFTPRLPTTSPAAISPAFPRPVSPLSANSLVLRLQASAADPLVSLAADIDDEGSFTISSNAAGVVIDFAGKIDEFPAYEAHAAYNGTTKTLFTSPPPPGNTVTDLPGPADRAIAARVAFP